MKTVTIDRLAFRGEGVGRVDQKVVFVPYAVPGDVLKIKILEKHKTFDRGEIGEILTPSESRVKARCEYFEKCGGCQWQNMTYERQVLAKEEIFYETLKRVGKIPEESLKTHIAPMLRAQHPWNYRQRIQLKVDFSRKALVGFYESGSHTIVPIDKCDIADPKINVTLQSLLKKGEIPTRPFEISVQEDGNVHIMAMDHVDRHFSQAHPEQNKHMIDAVLHYVFGRAEKVFKMRKNILELYAGSGNFTFPLAVHAGRVIAVEENPKAVKVGEKRAEDIPNIEWLCSSAEWGAKKVLRKKIPIDTVVLDPPRAGASDVLDLLMVLKPKTIVYVSCDPNTLARDLKELTKRFYRFDQSQPIDMFPQTYHIESVTKLSLV